MITIITLIVIYQTVDMGNYCCKYSVQTEQKTELTPMTYNETASGIPTNMNSAQMNHLTVNKTTEEGEPLSTANKTEPQGEGLQKKLKVRSKARAGRNENHNNEKGGNEVEEKGKEDYFSEHDDLESGGDDWDFKLVRHLHLIMAVDSSGTLYIYIYIYSIHEREQMDKISKGL